MRARMAMVAAMLSCALLGVWLLVPRPVRAHCDTMDGPVVVTAEAALEKGDVTPVLKWVTPANEQEVREAFRKTLAVRKKGPEAKGLADRYFFETLVRLHRAGEGAPYDGLRPAGTVEPIVAKADETLESGTVDNLVNMLNDATSKRIREAFALVLEKKRHADESVEAGREYVEAYVTYVHYVERIHTAIASVGGPHGTEGTPKPHEH